jgi:hypothetical protein
LVKNWRNKTFLPPRYGYNQHDTEDKGDKIAKESECRDITHKWRYLSQHKVIKIKASILINNI